MKKIITATVFFLLPFTVATASEDIAPLMEEGKGIIKSFFGELKGQLVKGMKEGGPVHTIGVCNIIAPQLAEAESQKSGWKVARTSLKVRNPDNTPDNWELDVLQQFEERKAKGEDPTKIAHGEIVEQKGRKVFRMMKAIPTAEVCTKCHGTQLPEPVTAKLDELYPNDQARGYKVGDLRGAFTLQKEL